MLVSPRCRQEDDLPSAHKSMVEICRDRRYFDSVVLKPMSAFGLGGLLQVRLRERGYREEEKGVWRPRSSLALKSRGEQS